MRKTIIIDGKECNFKSSAAIPRIYRMKFHRDIFKDLRDLEKSIDKNDPENSSLDLFSLEMFENIAYVMAKHADPSIPDTPEEWLDTPQEEQGSRHFPVSRTKFFLACTSVWVFSPHSSMIWGST